MGAIVDITTGKIIGAKEGTKVWYHEVGHLEFSKSDFGIRFHYWQQNIFVWVVATILIALLIGIKALIIIPVLLFMTWNIMELYEEWWCWKYAKNKKD